jgi:hypothetical protein
MNLLKIIFGVCAVILIMIPAVTSGLNSITKAKIEANVENCQEIEMMADGPVYVGEMYISGDGSAETAIVRSTAEQHLQIYVPRKGGDVQFKAYYYIYCGGWFDHGYVNLWVRGAATQQTDNGEFAEGYLYTTVPHCERGDTIEWLLTTTYSYLPTSPPIVNADGGGGACSFPFKYNELYSSPISLQLLAGKLDQLQSRQITIGGTIVCK